MKDISRPQKTTLPSEENLHGFLGLCAGACSFYFLLQLGAKNDILSMVMLLSTGLSFVSAIISFCLAYGLKMRQSFAWFAAMVFHGLNLVFFGILAPPILGAMGLSGSFYAKDSVSAFMVLSLFLWFMQVCQSGKILGILLIAKQDYFSRSSSRRHRTHRRPYHRRNRR